MDSHDNPSRRPATPLTADQQNARARAAAHRDGLYRRARRIRRSVASLAAVLFSTAFLVIYVQLASGHDPALTNAKRTATSSSSSKAAATSTSTESSTEGSTSETSGSSSSGESSSAAGDESSSGASAVTTSQS
jgi:cytoskeletal protein RodZ